VRRGTARARAPPGAAALCASRSSSHGAPEPLPADAPLEARVVALSRASERTLTHAGAWPRMRGPRLLPYERMRIWHESVAAESGQALLFDAADAGEPNLGFIAENRLLQTALLGAFQDAGGRLEPAQLSALEITDAGVNLTTSGRSLTARLVVGADGAQSTVRQAAGLSAEVSGYRQTAIVANVATTRPHQATAWQAIHARRHARLSAARRRHEFAGLVSGR